MRDYHFTMVLALELDIPCITNIRTVNADVHATAVLQGATMGVKPLQDHYKSLPYAAQVTGKSVSS